MLTLCKAKGQESNVAVKKLKHVVAGDEAKQSELEEEWQKEIQAHKEIAKSQHPHIIKFMKAITRGQERFLMFEWADGGNLREFWDKNNPHLSSTLVKDVLLQLRGLADALEEIHFRNFRHGDLKPENILQVKSSRRPNSSKLHVGTLKICDMGLTKYHIMATQLRQEPTST